MSGKLIREIFIYISTEITKVRFAGCDYENFDDQQRKSFSKINAKLYLQLYLILLFHLFEYWETVKYYF